MMGRRLIAIMVGLTAICFVALAVSLMQPASLEVPLRPGSLVHAEVSVFGTAIIRGREGSGVTLLQSPGFPRPDKHTYREGRAPSERAYDYIELRTDRILEKLGVKAAGTVLLGQDTTWSSLVVNAEPEVEADLSALRVRDLALHAEGANAVRLVLPRLRRRRGSDTSNQDVEVWAGPRRRSVPLVEIPTGPDRVAELTNPLSALTDGSETRGTLEPEIFLGPNTGLLVRDRAHGWQNPGDARRVKLGWIVGEGAEDEVPVLEVYGTRRYKITTGR